MSSEPAAVMDFLGVENDQRKSALLHSSLSKIKPQMMQQVLSWRGLLEKPKVESDCGKADLKKTMGLFPQTNGFGFFPQPKNENFSHSRSPANVHGRVFPSLGQTPCPTRKSPPQLTIFYNGEVNVFDVDEGKAEAIMTLAESLNSIPQNKKNPNTFGEEKYASIESPTADPRNSTSPQMRADLPIARKHSLQRFLQKRKDRLISKAPYETALPSKVTKDSKEESEIAAPECAASQTSRLVPVE